MPAISFTFKQEDQASCEGCPLLMADIEGMSYYCPLYHAEKDCDSTQRPRICQETEKPKTGVELMAEGRVQEAINLVSGKLGVV